MEYKIPENVRGLAERAGMEGDQELSARIMSSLASSAGTVDQQSLPDPVEYLKKVMMERGLRKWPKSVATAEPMSVPCRDASLLESCPPC